MTSNVMGRPKGATGAKSRAVTLLMQRRDYDPIEELITLLQDGDPDLGIPLDIDTKIGIHKELAKYLYPMRKAIEIEPGAGPITFAMISGIEGPPGSAITEDLGID